MIDYHEREVRPPHHHHRGPDRVLPPHKKSTINQREIGVDVPSFAEAIRRALRRTPT
jgi:twitching motility protein PilT